MYYSNEDKLEFKYLRAALLSWTTYAHGAVQFSADGLCSFSVQLCKVLTSLRLQLHSMVSQHSCLSSSKTLE